MKRLFAVLVAIAPYFAIAQTADSLWNALPIRCGLAIDHMFADTATNELYFYGNLGLVNNQKCNLIKWDGLNLTLIPGPFIQVQSIIRFKDRILAEGPSLPNNKYAIASYDGSSWTIIDSSRGIGYINRMLSLDDKVVFSGYFDSVRGQSIQSSGAVWDGGQNWSDFYGVDTIYDKGFSFYSLARYKNEIYIAGNMNSTSKSGITEIARFDGSSWKDVGGGIQGNGLANVWCMMVWKGDLYVGGEFFEKDGSPGNCIARWDGQKWHRLGTGVNSNTEGAVYDIAVYHDNLYIVGAFTHIGGIAANGIAKWNGQRWCSLNTSFDKGNVANIETRGDELYVAGGFIAINQDSSLAYAVKWQGGDYIQECGLTEAELGISPNINDRTDYVIAPNPSDRIIHVTRHFDNNIPVDMTVYNSIGDVVYRALSESFENKIVSLDLGNISRGIYQLVIRDQIGTHCTLKLIIE